MKCCHLGFLIVRLLRSGTVSNAYTRQCAKFGQMVVKISRRRHLELFFAGMITISVDN